MYLYMYIYIFFFFFFKQKTAYEIGTGDWSSDVCSSDLTALPSLGSKVGHHANKREYHAYCQNRVHESKPIVDAHFPLSLCAYVVRNVC